MRLRPDNTSLWINNYKRHDECRRTVDLWLASFPFQEVNIIANHPSINMSHFSGIETPINIHYHWMRYEWMTGCVAQNWNTAMMLTFLEKEWCVLSQDDNTIFPGWADKINSSDYDTYIAPAGDVVTIQSVQGLKDLGWYDERFRAIGGCEADYQLRCMRDNPSRSSIQDVDHIWKLSHNSVSLADHFKLYRTEHVLETRTNYNLRFAKTECFDRWIQKYGEGVDRMMCAKDYRNPLPGWGEIDWYPSFTLKMKELGRW